ncbi:MAG: response regulator [Phycisphaeraceae bacterium]|nr:response regulator [Phycisphaeraceae bacterium]
MTGRPKRVLVVEDESAQRLMYRRALASLGYDVECVDAGAGALASLDRAPAGVVILDLHLAGEHGMDLFETMRERHPAVSVVIATGHGSIDAMQRAIRLDVVDFLTKPVALGELESAVARAWDRHDLVEAPVGPDEDAGDALHGAAASGGASIVDIVARARDLDLHAMEMAAIREALRRCDNNRKAAADLLGISERTLYYRLAQDRLRRRR